MSNEQLPCILAWPISKLPLVGKRTYEALAKSQIINIFDLLLHVPKTIIGQEEALSLGHLENGKRFVVRGQVFGVKLSGIGKKKRLEAILRDDTGSLRIVFFGPATSYAQNHFVKGTTITVAGEAKNFLGQMQMVHPRLIQGEQSSKDQRQVATYSQIQGLAPATFKRIIDKAIMAIKSHNIPDHLPQPMLRKYDMNPLSSAIMAVHAHENPASVEHIERNRCPNFRRLAFEELLSFYLRLQIKRHQGCKKEAISIPKGDITKLSERLLPFELTAAQARVLDEIAEDIKKPLAMARLLQGDVGSGKTAVSAIIAFMVVHEGLQVAVLAPTEILAEQLFEVYNNFLGDSEIKIVLLTANIKKKDRRILSDQLKRGEISIVVGTHAVLSHDINFRKLGLVIIDEQHRFGVKQRSELLETSSAEQDFSPHLLVMSATPIPRSLALTLYGDLDLSVIDERPPGRIPIHTQVLMGPVLDTVARLCERILLTQKKAFIVFPLVEESENLDLENANKAFSFLESKFGVGSSALLHGKMKPEEKQKAISRFKENQISFLITTTVVEVGVDIPDATCMVIVHPERFGLAQLHQLRGRVGRKDLKSYCFLVTDLKNKFGSAYRRLDAMCKTDNGFKLSEIDLSIRGAGELLGTKQSGINNFLVFNHSDFADLISTAKTYAKELSQERLDGKHQHLYLDKSSHFS